MTKRQAAVKSNTVKVRNLGLIVFAVALVGASALTGCSYMATDGSKHMGTVVVKSSGYDDGTYPSNARRYELIRGGKEIFVAFPISGYSPHLVVGATYDDIVYTDNDSKMHTITISSVTTHDKKALEVETTAAPTCVIYTGTSGVEWSSRENKYVVTDNKYETPPKKHHTKK